MKFQAVEINGGFKDTKMVQFSNTGLGHAALPIPAGIAASYDQSWNQTEVGQFKQLAVRGIETAAGGRGISNFLRGGRFSADFGLTGMAERAGEQFGSMSVGQESAAAILQSTGIAEKLCNLQCK